MKIWKKVLCSLLVVVLCLTSAPLGGFVGLELPEWNLRASAIDEYKEGYYTYTVSNGEATITVVDSSISGDVVIPSTLGGYSVTTIGDWAFSGCDSFTSITIPESVTTIDNRAFYSCDSLTSITVDSSNPTYSSDSKGVLFNKGKTELIQYPVGKKDLTYTIPNSVKVIGDYSFANCDNLESVNIGDSVTTIGYDAFSYCNNIKEVTIGNSVTNIGDYAFYFCSGIKSITMCSNVTNIGEWAFKLYNKAFNNIVADIYYNGTEEQWKKINVGRENDDLIGATIHFNWGGTDNPDNPNDDKNSYINQHIDFVNGDTYEVIEYLRFANTLWDNMDNWLQNGAELAHDIIEGPL
ncbi:MAG: leucine-rich repeat domain-containing protein, partial [Clostridia bacterium]|nr:leucine-rich repeat domain-containing protein [Clostridia bacterium]